MKWVLAAVAMLFTAIPPTMAAENIDQINQLVQSEFRNLSEDLGAALSYKAVIPATPLGITGFDLGAFYTSIPGTNISLWGAEVRYAILEGGVAQPALGLRGTYTKLSGVDQLDFNTTGLELLISKGMAIFTPYAGVGRVWTTSNPVGVSNVSKEEFTQGKYFVGGNFNFGLANLALEADKTGDATSYGVKLGFRF